MKQIVTTVLLYTLTFNLFSQTNAIFTFSINDKYHTNTTTACIQLHVTAQNRNYIIKNIAYNYSDFPLLKDRSMGNYVLLLDTSNSLYDIQFSLIGLCAKFDTVVLPKIYYKEVPGKPNYYYNDTSIIYELCPDIKGFRKSLIVLIKRSEQDEIIKLEGYLWFVALCNSIEVYNCCEEIDY